MKASNLHYHQDRKPGATLLKLYLREDTQNTSVDLIDHITWWSGPAWPSPGLSDLDQSRPQ